MDLTKKNKGKTTGITQSIHIDDWPFTYSGQELIFGAIVALGVFPDFDKGEGYFCYADFMQGSNYTRFRLPNDTDLINGLFHILKVNMDKATYSRAIKERIRITRSYGGHHIELMML